ncbi:MAG: polyphenol oxidase family protein [Gemmatimonadota bacterium]
MTKSSAGVARVITEVPGTGPLPRYEIPGWRERFRVVAGLTGRGAEHVPFDLGLWTTQPVGEVMTRWRALRHAEPGFPAHVLGNQVHKDRVLWHEQIHEGWRLIEGVDGHATRLPGLMLYVTVADCTPVFLVDPVEKAISLIHAGWRGTAAGILRRAVEALSEHAGSKPEDIVMHCGVAICSDCYEVGSEVMEGLGLAVPGAGPWHADIRAVLSQQATQLGIKEISISGLCSAHDRKDFFSHRASGGTGGRMVAYFGIIP